MDGCDICGSAGLTGPLAARAPGGFGHRAGSRLSSFSEALPEGSFDLLLAGTQAVLEQKQGHSSMDSLPNSTDSSQVEGKGHPLRTGKSGEAGPQPSPGIGSLVLRNWQEDVARV